MGGVAILELFSILLPEQGSHPHLWSLVLFWAAIGRRQAAVGLLLRRAELDGVKHATNSSFLGSSRGLRVNSNFLRQRRKRNSNCNGMASSVSSTSNGSEHAVAAKGGDFLADADSTSCNQSDVPLNIDIGSKMVSKRSRSEITEGSSHAGKEVRENMQGTNGQGGCSWGWDEEGVVMDINILLSEFGDFSDFFQEDELDFGEFMKFAHWVLIRHHTVGDKWNNLLENICLQDLCSWSELIK